MATIFKNRVINNSSRVIQPWICGNCRCVTTSAVLQSGHNRWSTIRHDKGKNDAAKSKVRAIISKQIIQASKLYGPDPKSNPRLALAISNAKQSAMAKTTIDAAIARGQGITSSGTALEPVTIEAMFPPSVAIVIECQTDQKARLLQDMRASIKGAGGTATPTSYLFTKKGKVIFEHKPGLDMDDYLDGAIDAGATDVDSDDEGRLIIYTDPSATKSVADNLSSTTGLKIESIDIIWDPNEETLVSIDSEGVVDHLEQFINNIREDSSVQGIYMNYTTPTTTP